MKNSKRTAMLDHHHTHITGLTLNTAKARRRSSLLHPRVKFLFRSNKNKFIFVYSDLRAASAPLRASAARLPNLSRGTWLKIHFRIAEQFLRRLLSTKRPASKTRTKSESMMVFNRCAIIISVFPVNLLRPSWPRRLSLCLRWPSLRLMRLCFADSAVPV